MVTSNELKSEGDSVSQHSLMQGYPFTAKQRSTIIQQRCKYLLCFVLPLSSFLFLLTGTVGRCPTYDITTSLLWTLPFWIILFLDGLTYNTQTELVLDPSPKFYDVVLYVLIVLQVANVVLMLVFVSRLSWNSYGEILNSLVNLIVLRFLVGTSSGISGIVVAHELIHRPSRKWQLLGRLLLCTVFYDHFWTTHSQGHHENLGSIDDIATAKLGESFTVYWHRIYLGVFSYAWKTERKRLQKQRQ